MAYKIFTLFEPAGAGGLDWHKHKTGGFMTNDVMTYKEKYLILVNVLKKINSAIEDKDVVRVQTIREAMYWLAIRIWHENRKQKSVFQRMKK